MANWSGRVVFATRKFNNEMTEYGLNGAARARGDERGEREEELFDRSKRSRKRFVLRIYRRITRYCFCLIPREVATFPPPPPPPETIANFETRGKWTTRPIHSGANIRGN